MPAGKYTMIIEQGATFARLMTYKDSSGEPFDLTGCTARMHVRDLIDSETPVLELTTENGAITLGGTDGTIELILSPAQTSTIVSDGIYDIEVVYPTGDVDRVLQGKVILDKQVTR